MPNVTAKPVSIAELIDNYARVIEQRDKLLIACEAVLDALRKTDLNGQVLWLDQPYVLPGVHETAQERLMEVLGV